MVGGVADERREKGGGVEEEKGLREGGGGVGFWMGWEVKRVEAWEGEDGWGGVAREVGVGFALSVFFFFFL
ncbi:hypothetical protein ACFX2A_014047 [Malus domestica]